VEETYFHEIELRLTEDGKLPDKINCPHCGALVKRKYRKLKCKECDSVTTLQLPKGRNVL
jgi:Zn finger protein HypA/HybF involved in hydrogenase expression